MSRARKMLVGVVTLLSLVGIGGTLDAGSPDSAGSVYATRWCC